MALRAIWRAGLSLQCRAQPCRVPFGQLSSTWLTPTRKGRHLDIPVLTSRAICSSLPLTEDDANSNEKRAVSESTVEHTRDTIVTGLQRHPKRSTKSRVDVGMFTQLQDVAMGSKLHRAYVEGGKPVTKAVATFRSSTVNTNTRTTGDQDKGDTASRSSTPRSSSKRENVRQRLAEERGRLTTESLSDLDKVDTRKLREHISQDWKLVRQENLSKQQETLRTDALPGQQQPKSTHSTLLLSLGGNVAISLAKFYAYSRTGHSAMFSEAVHTLVDVGNQAILGYGLREAERRPDTSFHYGYGRAAFFYSLLAALSTFGFGSLYTFYQAVQTIMVPTTELSAVPETWAILGISFLIDGYVLTTAWQSVKSRSQKANVTPWQWMQSFRDPFVVSVVFEDSAAVLGVLLASGGIAASHFTGNHIWDALASLSISALLGAVSIKLISLNRQFILGKVRSMCIQWLTD